MIIFINPLIPENTWDYFCLDNILVHDSIITVLYDKTGERYEKGMGFKVFLNGKEVSSTPEINKLVIKL